MFGNSIINWTCKQCDRKVPMRPSEFPIHCSCGYIGYFAEIDLTQIKPIYLDHNNRNIDLLYIMNHETNPKWVSKKDNMITLFNNEIKCEFIETYKDISNVIYTIETKKPLLVINNALLIDVYTMEILTKQYPTVKFLSMNHSSQADLSKVTFWIACQNQHISCMLKYPNYYYGVPDERNIIKQILEHERLVTLLNPVLIEDRYIYKELPPKPTLSLICRWDALKNIQNQILACCLVNKIRPIRLLYCLHGSSIDLIKDIHRILPLEYCIIPWGDYANYITIIQKEVDIGLQVSFTESFNYVTIEHMACSKPVVGSSAIRFLPEKWQANADDFSDIARIILEILDDYENNTKLAYSIAKSTSINNNRHFIETIKGLLNG